MHPLPRTAVAQFLPFDVIQEIFSHHSTPLIIYTDNKPKIGFPWFLGHVCTTWRTVFLSMYLEFWNTLIMSPGAPLNTVDEKHSVDIVTTFMEHTKGQPISLFLYLCYIPRPVINIVVKHCKQWQRVELGFEIEEQHLSLLSPIKDQLPLLCSLRLSSNHPRRLYNSLSEFALFENAPLLTHVWLQHSQRWRFHWPSLSTLELHIHIKNDALLEILSQAENLETLHIRKDDAVTTSITMAIPMTRLKVLRTSSSTILAFLTAPSLEVLHIEIYMDHNFPVCAAFFGRSICRLLELSIGHCAPKTFATILPFVPTIKTLYVGCYIDSYCDDFFHALACPPGEPFQLPQLHTIKFSMVSPITEEEVTALRSMIMLRQPKMQQILIMPYREMFCEVQDRVLRLLEKLGRECEIQGVQIKIKPIPLECFVRPFYDGNRHQFDNQIRPLSCIDNRMYQPMRQRC